MLLERIRPIILALPEVEEYEHGGLPAFRVHGKRFATMLDETGINLMPGEELIRAWTAQWPAQCRERFWGPRLAAARVDYASLEEEIVTELVTEAWLSKAPARLARNLPTGPL